MKFSEWLAKYKIHPIDFVIYSMSMAMILVLILCIYSIYKGLQALFS